VRLPANNSTIYGRNRWNILGLLRQSLFHFNAQVIGEVLDLRIHLCMREREALIVRLKAES
jgi:hypothetical protein